MDIREMFRRVLIQAGQFLFTIENIELKSDQFVQLVRQCLAKYNKYSPEVRFLTPPSLQNTRQIIFTDAPRNPDGTLVSLNDLGIPDYISDAVPIRASGTLPFLLRAQHTINPELLVKDFVPFVYEKPTFTVSMAALFRITAVYRHKLICIESTNSNTKQFLVETIDDNDEDFFDLLTAKFMKVAGRSRRAFTIQDLPLQVDADAFVTEGETLEENAIVSMQENASIELSW